MDPNHAEIYFAGGCFWGTEQYFAQLQGVLATEVGYANGATEKPSYEEVCYAETGHAETVKVQYDPTVIKLSFLLELFYESINPTSVNRQGPDVGTQYRTGIYYVREADRATIEESIKELQERYQEPIAIEVKPLENYWPAEEYHQKYLKKHLYGYCHIPQETFQKAKQAVVERSRYIKPTEAQLQKQLSQTAYAVTQRNATEPPFRNAYWNNAAKGIYVDITTGEPLFSSADQFDAGCGWPSFAKPIDRRTIIEQEDWTMAELRTEVRSRVGDAHLGHVFEDGPRELGGLRYCINSAALRFIPKEEMEAEGYGDLLPFV